MIALYHYTCDHGMEGISREGLVHPNPVTKVSWFTDLATPDVDALGLTRMMLSCDRTQHRFRVTHFGNLRWFPEVAGQGIWLDRGLPGQHHHWWVATRPVSVIYDPIKGEA